MHYIPFASVHFGEIDMVLAFPWKWSTSIGTLVCVIMECFKWVRPIFPYFSNMYKRVLPHQICMVALAGIQEHLSLQMKVGSSSICLDTCEEGTTAACKPPVWWFFQLLELERNSFPLQLSTWPCQWMLLLLTERLFWLIEQYGSNWAQVTQDYITLTWKLLRVHQTKKMPKITVSQNVSRLFATKCEHKGSNAHGYWDCSGPLDVVADTSQCLD